MSPVFGKPSIDLAGGHTMARDAVLEVRERTDMVELVGTYVQLKLIELNELAATFYSNILLNTAGGEVGRTLATDRGLNAEMIERFRLGFALDSWDALLRFFQSRNIDPELAAEAGLLQTRDSGGF